MKTRRQFTLALLAVAIALPFSAVQAQPNWPAQPVRFLVGFPAGSSPDITARALAEPLSKALGQPVVVDNKPGASGDIAADLVAKSHDDHTIGLVINGNLTSSKMLKAKLPFDPAKDFALLSLLVKAPMVLVAPNALPTGKAYFEAGKAAAGKWNYGSPGVGTLGHLGVELLRSKVPGFDVTHVPYAGTPAIVTAILGGQDVQLSLIAPGVAMPQVQAGKLHAIGVTSNKPSALVPGVPSLSDAGIADFNLEVWNGLVAPAGLPKAAQDKLSAAVVTALKDPALQKRMFDLGWEAVGSTPAEFEKRVNSEAAALGAIIQSRGIKAE